jgi:hypothetical protein
VALQGCSDVKRELVIPAQSAAGLQAWYRITRARGLPGVTRGYKGLQASIQFCFGRPQIRLQPNKADEGRSPCKISKEKGIASEA